MLALALVLPLLARAQDPAVQVAPDDPSHRFVELALGEGGAGFELATDFEGTLHVWARSQDLEPRLALERGAQGPLADEDSGGGKTAYLALAVRPGEVWSASVHPSDPSASGTAELHWVAAPETEATQAAAREALARSGEVEDLASAGDPDAARALLSEAAAALCATAGARRSEAVARAAWELGFAANDLGAGLTCGELWGLARDHRERTLPEDHPDLLQARKNLAAALSRLGDLAGARALDESVLAGYERTLPEDHPDLLGARLNLAISLSATGDLAGARALRESVLASCERTLPEDHPDLLRARLNLATSLLAMGELAEARALQEGALAGYERILPEDHPRLLLVRGNLASSLSAMGEFAAARALREGVLAAYEGLLPEDHPRLLLARASLATSLDDTGELARARALRESVLASCERTLPEGHPDLLRARENLAASMLALGDLAGARALQEDVLAARERSLPADHPELLAARANLAISMEAMGDLAGARALRESVLAGFERTLPEDNPDLVAARANLAVSLEAMGELSAARTLKERVLASYERMHPEGHPYLLLARGNLASSLFALGDLAGARALRESVVAACERTLPEHHPSVLVARANLAVSMSAMGELAGARALLERVLAARERTLPEEHPDVLSTRSNLAVLLYALGDRAGARAQVTALAAGALERVLASLALAPRQARQTVQDEEARLSGLLFWSAAPGADGGAAEPSDPELRGVVFELLETMRLVAGEAARSLARHDADPELAPILEEAAAVRAALNDLVAGAARRSSAGDEVALELTRLSLRRDRLERDASRRLAERGVVTQRVAAPALAAALAPDEAAVGYRRSARWVLDEESGLTRVGADHLLAHVLRSDGTLARVDLGPAAELEELAGAWRAALGAPLLRGVAPGALRDDPEAACGAALRARLLDPVLAQAGEEARRLFVCADDLVYLVPLDALPLDERAEERVGDRFRIVNEVSFARLLARAASVAGEPTLLAMGGADYDAPGSAPAGLRAASAPIDEDDEERAERAPRASTTRSALPERFQKLLQSRYEAEAVADLFEEAFEVEPTLLTREETTKAALFAAAPGKRFLHMATHGWFAPESVRSSADAAPAASTFARMSLEERSAGLAPMTLCGLALAGANHGRDALGRVTGILTAEELCTLDLSACELAVLSACETNVGIRRAGQGIQSLQSALYAAGARASVTSLWKVDDAATRRLFEVFYTGLWDERLPKLEALWSAKRALRDEGHPPAHWAAWVLTGDPE